MKNRYGNLSPFPINRKVLSSIRPMLPKDIRIVSELHKLAMGNSLWAQLGIDFLEALYEQLLLNPRFIAYVYEDKGKVDGFIAGTSDSANLFISTLRYGWKKIFFPLLKGILRRPQLIGRLLSTHTYFALSSNSDIDNIKAESLFCSFRPNLRGKRIAGHINKVLFEHFLSLGIESVKITTEVDNIEANRQLKSWGFEPIKKFHFYGKDMITYVLHLVGHPRLNI